MIKHVASGTIFIVALLALGIWGLANLEFRLFPDIKDPRLFASVELDRPDEFRESISKVLIDRLEQNPNVSSVRIKLNKQSAKILIRISSSNDADISRMQIQDHLDQIFNDLIWEGALPVLRVDTKHEIPLTELHVSTNDFAGIETWVNHFIIKQLWSMEGIGRVELLGYGKKSLTLTYPDSPGDSLFSTLDERINDVDRLTGADWEYPGKDMGALMQTEIIDGVRMKDILHIGLIHDASMGGIVRDGKPILVLRLFPTPNADILRVNSELSIYLRQLKDRYPNYEISFFNNRIDVVRSEIGFLIGTVVSTILICMILVRLILRDFRICLWIATILILSISSTALICAILHLTLDLFSIVGVVLGIGLLVDSPIVVADSNATSGRRSLRPVWRSLIISNSTTVAVFFPILLSVPFAKELFSGMLINMTLLLFFSMLYSYLVTSGSSLKTLPPPIVIHRWIYCKNPNYRNTWIGVLFMVLVISFALIRFIQVEWLPPSNARVWNKESNIPIHVESRENVKHIIYKYNSKISNTVEFAQPQFLGLGWKAGDDPFQEIFQSFEAEQKWYRPNLGHKERDSWDRYGARPVISWNIDTTVVVYPAEVRKKDVWQKGAHYRWILGSETPPRRSQMTPLITYDSDFLYRDRKGVYKTVEEHSGELDLHEAGLLLEHSAFPIMSVTGIVVLLLWGYFNSLRLSIIAMISWPLSIAGSIIFLHLFSGSLNLFSLLAILFTTGVSMNDAVIKIDAFRSFLKGGHSCGDAIELACLHRLRPIFLTSVTTLASCLVLVFQTGTYNQFNYSVAVSISGGILFSSIGAIWVIPALLNLIHPSYRMVQPTA